MVNLFFDSRHRLRNGWWMLVFVAFTFLTALAYRPLSRGLRDAGIAALALEPLPFLFSLVATWACLRPRKEPLSAVGFQLDRR